MDQIPAHFLTIENIDLVSSCLQMGYRLPSSASPDAAVLMDFVQESGLTSFKAWTNFQTETPVSETCSDNLKRWLVWSVWCWMKNWAYTYPFLDDAEGWLRDTVSYEDILNNPLYRTQSDHQSNRAVFLMLAITSPYTRQICHNLFNVAYHEPEIFDMIGTRLQFLTRLCHWLPDAPIPKALPREPTEQMTMEAGDLDMDEFMNDPDLPEGEITNRLAPEWP